MNFEKSFSSWLGIGAPGAKQRPLKMLLRPGGYIILAGLALASVPPAQPQASAHPEAEIVTLGYHGFEPRSIKRGPGTFFLLLANGTRLSGLEFSLEDGNGNAVHSVIPLGVSNNIFRDLISLGPGTYVLKVKQLPNETVSFVVSPMGK